MTTGKAKGTVVSSTRVRRLMSEGGANALERLVADGVLPACVAEEVRRELAGEGACGLRAL